MEKLYCQYGRNCFRRNDEHLRNYRHEHLDKILNETTPENIRIYTFPNDLMTMRDVIIDQIKVMRNLNAETLQSQNRTDSSTNVQQMSKDADVENVMDIKPNIRAIQNENAVASTSSNVAACSFVVKSVKKEKIRDNVMVKQEPIESFRPMTVKLERPQEGGFPSNHRSVADKLAAANPYNYFLTAIESSPQTKSEPLTITFPELLDGSLGDLERSIQINCLVQPDWLIDQYALAGQLQKPMLILTGNFTEPLGDTMYPHIKSHIIQMNWGTHHTKMMLFAYTDGSMRVIVSTANLYEADWRNHTQGTYLNNSISKHN